MIHKVKVSARLFEPSGFYVVDGSVQAGRRVGRRTGKDATFVRRKRVQNLRRSVAFRVLENVDERFARPDVGNPRRKEENRFADLNLIAVEQAARFDAATVDVNAVRTFEVDQRSTVDAASYFGVPTRNFGVAKSNFIRRVASDRRRFIVESETVPLVVTLNDKKRVQRRLRSVFSLESRKDCGMRKSRTNASPKRAPYYFNARSAR